MIRVGVLGAGGRMGGEVCRAVAAAPDMKLVAAVDPAVAGRPLAEVAAIPGSTIVVSDDLEVLTDREVDVAVDFTVAASALENVRWCVRHAVNVVVGTTGLSERDLQSVVELLEEEGSESNVFYAPNFAIGAVMMMRFARMAASWFPDAEVIELHHASKRDSPSGTSLATVAEIVAGRAEARFEAVSAPASPVEVLPGARGAEKDGVNVHSVRLPGLVAHQEVIFGGPGQTLTIRHDTTDRAAFMPGVLLAIRAIPEHFGLTIGLEALLGL